MDRIDAMRVFVAAVSGGSLAAAGRRLGKSPAAVSRAIASLESHVGAELLHRSTRSMKLSEIGERYAVACRRVLADLEEADQAAMGLRSAPRGTLTLTAPVAAGESILRPVLDAYMDAFPDVSMRLQLLDQPVNLIDDRIDIALRIAHLPDSTLVALPVAHVRRVVAASPRYLARRPPIRRPADLGAHQIIAMTHFGIDSWSFASKDGSTLPRVVHFRPRLIVNSIRAAVASAVQGHGVVRLFSYHVSDAVVDGGLVVILEGDEPPPLPVHLVCPSGRLAVPKVRAFVDFALPRLRGAFADVVRGSGTAAALPGGGSAAASRSVTRD